jgi:hypothetical protein
VSYIDQRPCEIYTLSDPDTGQVRYVGRSRNARRRLYDHVAKARSTGRTARVYCWIRSLLARGVLPMVEVVEVCPADQWAERERFWITSLRASGVDLTNLNDGGYGPWDVHPETRARLSAATAAWNRGRKGTPASAHARSVWSAAHRRRMAGLSADERKQIANRAMSRRPGWNKLNRTHCVHGHEYNKRNTYTRKSGIRVCLECQRIRARAQVSA